MKDAKHILILTCTSIMSFSCQKNSIAPAEALETSIVTDATTYKVPPADHVVVLILENYAYEQIIGSSSAPYINALAKAAKSTSFTNSYAIEHPSQPNYLDLYSGSNQGVTNDNLPNGIPFTTANLGRQLLDSGKTYTTFSEDLPGVGYNGAKSGKYARKHNPAANWMGTGINQIPSTTNQPFTTFPTDYTQLPTVSFVVPNLNYDMHGGSIATGDTWIKNNMDGYIQWAKTHNSIFILTFDEDNHLNHNHITTIFSGQHVKTLQDTVKITHYSVLRTLESMYKLKYAGNAKTAKTINNCWR